MADKPLGSGARITMEERDAPFKNAVVFFVFVVFGAIYIVVAKLGGVRQSYVTFAPVAIMFGYAGLVWFAKALRLRDDQSGDNLYYMGFLFTLTSLGVSLYQFSVNNAAEEIVQNFGIAIGSTIAGIGLRVFFNQMRRDPVEVERASRLELADSARRVRRELDSTAAEFNHFRRSVQQMLQEGVTEHAKNLGDAASKLTSVVEDITTRSAIPLEDASRKSGSTIEALTNTVVAALEASARQLSTETERLSKSANTISSTLDGVSASLESMHTPDKIISIQIDPVVKALTNVTQELQQHLKDHATQIGLLLEKTADATHASTKAVEAVTNYKTDSTARADHLVMSLETILKAFERAAHSIEVNSARIASQPQTAGMSVPTTEALAPFVEDAPARRWWR